MNSFTGLFNIAIMLFSAGMVSCTTFSGQSISNSNQPNLRHSITHGGPSVALVLGGGGAKGFAHIGVLKELEANGIQPDMVVGTSAGSFIGALYASGMPATSIEQLALTVKDSDLTDFTLSRQGIIEGEKLRQFVNTQVNHQKIQDFPLRFAAVATEKHSLKLKVFTQGEAGLVVQASSSVPYIFIAPRIPEIGGKKYMDGGLVSMVPVDVATALGADVIIAVDVMHMPVQSKSTATAQSSIWSMIDTAYMNEIHKSKYGQTQFDAMQAEINRADVVIRPELSSIGTFDTTRRQDAIKAGSKATKGRLSLIHQALNKNTALNVVE